MSRKHSRQAIIYVITDLPHEIVDVVHMLIIEKSDYEQPIRRIITRIRIRRWYNSVYARHRVLLNRCARSEIIRHTALPATQYAPGGDTGYPNNLISISFRPRSIHQTGVLPGDCWAFKGSNGSVVIRLLGYVNVSGISLEHISSSISPTGETDTAPRDFSVWVSRS